MNRGIVLLFSGIILTGLLATCTCSQANAQQLQTPWPYQLSRYYYYPYYFFPHNYWPQMRPRWPEGPGQPYQPPPAYQAYPPFREPNWHYNYWQPHRYYTGTHFWLDQF